MKFRVSKDDLIIFIVFCILLLYLCAIAVVNFVSFGQKGELAGLDPFPAFSGDYIAITFTLFVATLIVIFTSVSSYIFSREKGPGFGIKIGEKEEKGYNRWAKTKEIKEAFGVEKMQASDPTSKVAGIPLFCDKKNNIWVDNGDFHTLVIGSSGSGKTRCVVKPLVNILAKNNESMIITDPKGEIYQESAGYLKSLGYNVVVLNFREPSRGNAWNPLALPYQFYKNGDKDKAIELLDDVSSSILDNTNKNDPFWDKSASSFFSGLALSLFENAKEEETNLNSINAMATDGDVRFGTSKYINEYFKMMGTKSNAYTFASGTIESPSDTQGGILATFREKIRTFTSRDSLSEMLGHSDFNMRDIGKGKTAVFIIIHDEKTTYHGLATIFIKQCYETLIDVAQENGGKLPYRTNFILDEFANMPPLKDVDSMVSAARSRLIRFTFIIQNYAQLNDVYGKEVAEVIKGNCSNTIYLISTELAALEEISKVCGEVKSKKDDKTASTPLITVTDLQHMMYPDAILLRLRSHPFKTKLPLNDKVDWGHEITPAPYPKRELQPISIFDIQEYVKEKKKEQTMNSMTTPLGGGMGPGFNPFMGPMGGMGSSPMGGMNPMGPNPMGPNPMGGMNPMGSNPMGGMPKNPFGPGGLSEIDIDQMMRDIDKKIAELDAEEARKKEELARLEKEEKTTPAPEVKDVVPEPVQSVPEQKEPVSVHKDDIKDIESLIAGSKTQGFDVKPQMFEEKPVVEEPKVEEKKPEIFKDLNFELPSVDNMMKKEEPKVEVKEEVVPQAPISDVPKPRVNVDADSIVVDENVISDDEFFDDFFGDDDE